MMEVNRSEVIKKLYEYSSKDPQLALFGAKKHQYKLRSPLKQEIIQTYEALNTITLPADFVSFYSTIGGGGAGPYYGLHDTFLEIIFIPTPVFAFKCRAIDINFGHIDFDEIKPLISVNKQMGELVIELGEEASIIKLLEIGEFGCGYFIYLIVSGPDYGKVAVGIYYAETEIENSKVTYLTYEVLYNDFHSYYQDWLLRIVPHQLSKLSKI